MSETEHNLLALEVTRTLSKMSRTEFELFKAVVYNKISPEVDKVIELAEKAIFSYCSGLSGMRPKGEKGYISVGGLVMNKWEAILQQVKEFEQLHKINTNFDIGLDDIDAFLEVYKDRTKGGDKIVDIADLFRFGYMSGYLAAEADRKEAANN